MAQAACIIAGLAVLASGCRNPQHTGGDPLMGPVNPPGINGQPMPTSPAPAKAQASAPGTPATPTSQFNNTPAGLVNNTQIPTTKPLTIGDTQGGPNWQLTNTSKDPSKTPTVVPVPRDQPPTSGGNAQPGTISSGIVPSSWNSPDRMMPGTDPLAQLRAKGAVGEQSEKVPEGVRVTCFLPRRDNPANFRQYEVTAADLPTAVQAILRQIDNGR